MATVIMLEKDKTTRRDCGCTEMYQVVEKDVATGRIVRVLASGVKNYQVAASIRDTATGMGRR